MIEAHRFCPHLRLQSLGLTGGGPRYDPVAWEVKCRDCGLVADVELTHERLTILLDLVEGKDVLGVMIAETLDTCEAQA
jgi:hypothetical protein